MFDSETLEVGIGMVFLFLMMSLICTGIREFIEGILKWRAMNLERAIRTLLDDQDGGLAAFFFAHPLISSLYQGRYDPSRLGGRGGAGARLFDDAAAQGSAAAAHEGAQPAGDGRNMPWSARLHLPSYIPSELFAKALIDLVARGPADSANGTMARPLSMALLQERAATLASPFLRRAMQSAIDHSGGDLERLKRNLQQWFDGAMDRAAGWYKRRTQVVLFVLGLGAAVLLNVDALYVMSRLTTDKILRDAVVAAAANAREPVAAGDMAGAGTHSGAGPDTGGLLAAKKARDELNAIGMPMGWVDAGSGQTFPFRPIQSCRSGIPTDCGGDFGLYRTFQMVTGWLITAIGVMLGAPFWFDVLNKFMVIRATVKPHEKSPEEGSEDRRSDRPAAPPPPAPPAR